MKFPVYSEDIVRKLTDKLIFQIQEYEDKQILELIPKHGHFVCNWDQHDGLLQGTCSRCDQIICQGDTNECPMDIVEYIHEL